MFVGEASNYLTKQTNVDHLVSGVLFAEGGFVSVHVKLSVRFLTEHNVTSIISVLLSLSLSSLTPQNRATFSFMAAFNSKVIAMLHVCRNLSVRR